MVYNSNKPSGRPSPISQNCPTLVSSPQRQQSTNQQPQAPLSEHCSKSYSSTRTTQTRVSRSAESDDVFAAAMPSPNMPSSNGPDYLVLLHLVTTGLQGDDLGSDEHPIAWWTFLVLDVANNKVTAVQNYPIRPLIDPNHMESENESEVSSVSEECFAETGITDSMVENGMTLEQVLDEFDRFLRQRGIHPDTGGKSFGLVTEGQLPMRLVLHPETCGKQISLRNYPYFYNFYDLRKEFVKFYKAEEAATGLDAMMENLDIEGDKSLEFGVRRCQDMARIVTRLNDDGHKWEKPEIISQCYFPAVVRRSDVIEEDTVVRARGLPWQATDCDIDRFFRGLNIVPGGIALVLSKVGRRNGEALVRFASREHRDLAVRKHKHHMSQRYIEVYISSGREFISIAGGETKEAEEFLKKLTYPEQTLVRMRGLPYTTTAEQILKFFANTQCKVQNDEEGILFVNHRDGRSTGDAFVVFGSAAEADLALQNHRQHIGDRYIELFKSTPAEVNQVMNSVLNPTPASSTSSSGSMTSVGAHLSPDTAGHMLSSLPFTLGAAGLYPGAGTTNPAALALSRAGTMAGTQLNHNSFIRVRGMPVDATVADILKFLDTLSQYIVFQGVHLVYNTLGHPAGEAIIQMTSELAAAQVVEEKHKKLFYLSSGKRSQVEVTRCNPSDIAQFSGLLPQTASTSPMTASAVITAAPVLSPGEWCEMPVQSTASTSCGTSTTTTSSSSTAAAVDNFVRRYYSIYRTPTTATNNAAAFQTGLAYPTAPQSLLPAVPGAATWTAVNPSPGILPATAAAAAGLTPLQLRHTVPSAAPGAYPTAAQAGMLYAATAGAPGAPGNTATQYSSWATYPTMMAAQQPMLTAQGADPTALYYLPTSMAPSSFGQGNTMTLGNTMNTVIAKGLPADAMLEEILSLFDSINAGSRTNPDVKVGLTQDGKPSGEAFISFHSRVLAERAVTECNRKLLRNHYVELSMAHPGFTLA